MRLLKSNTLLLLIILLLIGNLSLQSVRLYKLDRRQVERDRTKAGSPDSPLQARTVADSPSRAEMDHFWSELEELKRLQAEINEAFQPVILQPVMDTSLNQSPTNFALLSSTPTPEQMERIRYMRHMQQVHHQINTLLEDFMSGHRRPVPAPFNSGWDELSTRPALDMRDGGTNYIVVLSMPSIHESSIRVRLDGRLLTIAGTAVNRRDDANGNRRTRSLRFARQIRLPGPVQDADTVRASHEDGVLTVNIPKAEETDPPEQTVRVL